MTGKTLCFRDYVIEYEFVRPQMKASRLGDKKMVCILHVRKYWSYAKWPGGLQDEDRANTFFFKLFNGSAWSTIPGSDIKRAEQTVGVSYNPGMATWRRAPITTYNCSTVQTATDMACLSHLFKLLSWKILPPICTCGELQWMGVIILLICHVVGCHMADWKAPGRERLRWGTEGWLGGRVPSFKGVKRSPLLGGNTRGLWVLF